MGNSGRQALAGKRLASLHQRISSDGAANVQTAESNENRTRETEVNTTNREIAGAFTLRYVTLKKRRANSTPHKAKTSPEPSHPYNHVNVSSSKESCDKPQDVIDDESSQKFGKDCGELCGFWGRSTAEEVRKESTTSGSAARARESHTTAQIPDDLQETDFQDQDHTSSQFETNSTNRLDECGTRALERRRRSEQESISRPAQRSVLEDSLQSVKWSDPKPIRVPKVIRSRKRSTDLNHAGPKRNSGYSICVNESTPKPPKLQAAPGENPCTIVVEAAGIQTSFQNDAAVEDSSPRSATAASESSSTRERPAVVSPTRAPSLSFKAKKLRGKFDGGILEQQFGVELSLENVQRLRVLSGNDMGAAVNLYLQGYCNVSENGSPEASSLESKPSGRHRQPESGGASLSSIEFWRQRRQSANRTLSCGPEASEELPCQDSRSSDDDPTIAAASDQDYIVGGQEKAGPLSSRGETSEATREVQVDRHDDDPVFQHKVSPEKVVPEKVVPERSKSPCDWDRHCQDSSISMENAAAGNPHSTLFDTTTSVVDCTSPKLTEANDASQLSGAGPVPLRGMQGFTNQENVRPRNPPLSTSRLPNGKLGMCLNT
jgi:hypothetical protein